MLFLFLLLTQTQITMRGAERPAKVRWSHPFLSPLKPLSDGAARQTFIDVADDVHNSKDINQLLALTDNMPLAVELIAHLVDYEDCANVLARWETEKTALLSDGYDKRSNLDASIEISLSSPRITSFPGTKELLALLSILPDGLSDVELVQIQLPIENILTCKATLLGTSLAYMDDTKRLKSLSPIREHVHRFHPPQPALIRPLRTHFNHLLDLFKKYGGALQVAGRVSQITSNLGNLHQLLVQGLDGENPDLADTIRCAISLADFRRQLGHGPTALLEQIPSLLPQLGDHQLETLFLAAHLHNFNAVVHWEPLVAQVVSHFSEFDNTTLQCEFNPLLV
jgi:hypothetical protein